MRCPPRVLGAVVTGAALADLRRWASQTAAWPIGSHRWGQYAEQTPAGVTVCRTENVSACHAGFAGLVTGAVTAAASEAFGEEAVAFKDKLNYKHPGGAGFSTHQDAPAYPGVCDVVSVLVAVDECTTSSGCLWFASGVDEVLPTDDRGVVRSDVAEALEWAPAELHPGDAVCFDGLVPHASEANRSSAWRRVLVASFAPAREGYGRERYYSSRRAVMDEAADDGRLRISTLADFEGVAPPGAAPTTTAACTHEPAHG